MKRNPLLSRDHLAPDDERLPPQNITIDKPWKTQVFARIEAASVLLSLEKRWNWAARSLKKGDLKASCKSFCSHPALHVRTSPHVANVKFVRWRSPRQLDSSSSGLALPQWSSSPGAFGTFIATARAGQGDVRAVVQYAE